jgi:hypothetical protein
MELEARLRACWQHKVAVCLGLAVGICVPYWVLQQVQLAPLVAVPETALDRAIAFSPAWTPVYLSIAALVPMAPWLAGDRDAVLRYAWGLTLLCLPSFVMFAAFPAMGPRPADIAAGGIYELLASHDRPTNALPSLHAGLTVYSLLVLERVVGNAAGRGLRAAGWAWGAAILFSTLATKQHQLLDLPAGIALALAAFALAWRNAPGPRAVG